MDGAGGQGNGELHPAASVSVWVIRDILDLFLLPTADLKGQRSLSGVRGHLLVRALIDRHTFMKIKATQVHWVHETSRRKRPTKETMLSCILKHNCVSANSTTSTRNKKARA